MPANRRVFNPAARCCLLLGALGLVMAQEIRPLDWSLLGNGPGDDELAGICATIIAQAQQDVARHWLKRIEKADRIDGLIDFGHHEGHIRGTASPSRTLVLCIRLGLYQAERAGAERAAIEELLPLVVRSLAKDHTANGGLGDKSWGDQWQSAMWAAQTAQVAWIVWDRLEAEDRSWVIAMLAHEADRFLTDPPPTSDAKSVKDTKGEENAWNASCLLTAATMLVDHPHEAAWRERAIVYLLNAVATPADVTSELVVDGKPLRERLVGYCMTEDYAAGNHGAYPHPGYTASSHLNPRQLFFTALAGVQPPEALLFNAAPIYRMFVDHRWEAPPCMEPGGTIYTADGGIYWPTNKERERAGRYYKWFKQDLVAATYGYDTTCSTPAAQWARLHGDLIVRGLRGQPTPVELDAYSSAGFLKAGLTCYLVRTLHAQQRLPAIRVLPVLAP